MPDVKPSFPEGYVVPAVWKPKPSEGHEKPGAHRHAAGVRQEQELQRGRHPLQLYSLGTPNGVKVTILLEELVDLHQDFEYDAWKVALDGSQFGSDFVKVNPNSKIPCLMDYSDPACPIRVFESGAILLYIAEKYDKDRVFLPREGSPMRAECLSWLMFQVGSGPYVGNAGFGQWYNAAPVKIEYAIDRAATELKRLLDVLDQHLAGKAYMCGDMYTVADMALWPWYGALVLGRLWADSAAKEFLQLEQYTNVLDWAIRVSQRPAVIRGRMVNRSWGDKHEQLIERHERKDFQAQMSSRARL